MKAHWIQAPACLQRTFSRRLLPSFGLVGALIAGLLLGSCGGSGVRIASTNFDGVVEPMQNLVFTFNQAVVATEVVGRWDTTAYVKISPKVAGRYMWTAPNELVFSPVAGFGASTEYEARPTEAVLQHAADKQLRLGSTDPIRFHTPYLDLTGVSGYWTLGSDGQAAPSVRLLFNYGVDAKALAERLSVKSGDKAVTARVISTGVNRELTVELLKVPMQASEDVIKLEIAVAEGLPCAESDYVTKAPLSYTYTIPAKPTLSVSNVEVEPGQPRSAVRIMTTQAVPNTGLTRYITVEPAVSFTAEATDYGIRLEGDFEQSTTYTLRISENLVGVLGTRLGQAYEQSLSFVVSGRAIQFASERGQVLSASGARNVGVRLLGVNQVQVRLFKVYENNLQAFFRQGRGWGDYYSEDNYYSYQRYDTEPYGDLLWEKEYEARSLPLVGGMRLLNVNTEDRRRDFKGIYVLEVVSKEHYWVRATKVLSLTDVGMMARTSSSEVLVFAHSLLTAEPLKGVNLTLWSTNNQPIATATTDGSGLARMSDLPTVAPGFRWALVTAHRPGSGQGSPGRTDDFGYLQLSQPIETSRFEVGGKVTSGRSYDAYVYGERELYRPGDTIRFNSIVRSLDWQPVADMPVKLKVLMPSGAELARLRGTLNAQGAWGEAVAVPAAAMTGSYTLELYSGSDELLGSRTVSVEEFVPDRIKVNVQASTERVAPGANVEVKATALNLFGPPAAGRNYEVALRISPASFTPEGYEAYNFNLTGVPEPTPVLRSGTTDAQGQLSERFGPFNELNNEGLLEARALVTVMDETGRPVGRSVQFEIITQPVMLGLKGFDGYQPLNQPLSFAVCAVNLEGKPAANAQARVVVVRKHWDVVLERDYNTYRYRSVVREQVMSDRLIALTQKETPISFTPTQWGEYEVRVYKPGAARYVVGGFYSYGWDGGGSAATVEVDPEGRVIIEANKASYEAGESAELLFKTPFDGRLIVTVERDRIFEHHVLTTSNNSATLRLSLKDEHLPNVYVGATLIRAMNGPALPLTVAHGYRSLRVEKGERKLNVTVTAAEKSTSRRSQTITVETAPGAEVTIAAVDEGILQIMNSTAPDPYGYFYAKRALEVGAYDLYRHLLPELKVTSSPGGDGYAEQSDRANPLSNKRIKLVRYWSGPLKADGSGRVTYTIDLPAFSGQLRLMATAYKGAAFGAGQRQMTVADPVVISAGLPRFMSPGDTVLVPVTLANTTKAAMNATAALKSNGPLQVMGRAQTVVNLPAQAEQRVVFTLVAANDIGSGTAEVTVKAGGGTYTEKVDMTVRPAAGYIPLTGAGAVEAGKTGRVDFALPSLLPASRRARLIVSRSPAAQFGKSLSFLLEYPHGCVEQTVSRAFPMLYFTDLARELSTTVGGGPNLSVYYVREAIAKLQAMQQPNGGLSFWPGSSNDDYAWGSVYAAHFFHEAKRAGYDVAPTVQQRLDDYLIALSSKHELEKMWWTDNSVGNLTRREIPYALYVLALRGKPQPARMNFYKSRPELLTADSRYLLAAAYALSGDPAAANYLLPQALGKVSRAESGGSLGSPIRDRALALLMLQDINPKHAQVPELARELSKQLDTERWLSTQDAAWGFLAIGKLARASADAQAEVRVAGKSMGELPRQGELNVKTGLAGKTAEISASGGPVYYFWQAVGIGATNDAPEGDNGLRVRRNVFDRNGNLIMGNAYAQGELVVVKLTVELLGDVQLQNVVISDLLPAGWEVENPRIREVPGMAWVKADIATHTDLRDDRVNFYANLYSGRTYEFAYVVRAVTQGSYQQGPATADAMYRPEFRSANGARTVRIGPPRSEGGQ